MRPILRLPESVSLAIRAAGLLAAGGGSSLSAEEIAAELHASRGHLSKVLMALSRAGILESRRGPGGGFQLALSPERIALRQVYEVIEGPVRAGDGTPCALGLGGACVLSDLMHTVNGMVIDYFERTTLADLAGAMSHAQVARTEGGHDDAEVPMPRTGRTELDARRRLRGALSRV